MVSSVVHVCFGVYSALNIEVDRSREALSYEHIGLHLPVTVDEINADEDLTLVGGNVTSGYKPSSDMAPGRLFLM